MGKSRATNGGFVPHESGSFSILDTQAPVAGVDYPRDEADFERMFASEGRCRLYLEGLRFPRGFVCPSCGDRQAPWRSGTGLLACIACRSPHRTTFGTLFDGSLRPLSRWFRTLWEVTAREDAVGPITLQRTLGTRDPRQARRVLESIRALMAVPAREPLAGDVQMAISRLDVDGLDGRAAVGVVLQSAGGDRSRIRLRHLERLTPQSIVEFAHETVAIRSRIRTQPWAGFSPLSASGYDHRIQPMAEGDVQQVMSLIKLWLWSSARVRPADLDARLQEFGFRYNRRSYPQGLLFYRLLTLAVLHHRRGGQKTRHLRAVG